MIYSLQEDNVLGLFFCLLHVQHYQTVTRVYVICFAGNHFCNAYRDYGAGNGALWCS